MAIELKGRLDNSSLNQIFGILMEQLNACSLLVSDGVSEKIFYFTIGGVRLVSLGGRKAVPIGEILVRGGRLTQPKRDKVLDVAREQGRRFGETAMMLGYVTRADVEEAVRRQVEAEICDLFLWEDAEYEFREGQPPEQFYDSRYQACSVSVDVPEFVTGVQERRAKFEEVRKRIPSDREIFELTERGAEIVALHGEDVASRILAAVDGRRRVREIIETSGFTALAVFESMFLLIDEGLIRRSKASRGFEELGREEILEEIARLEQGRTEMVGDLILRTRLAKAYEQIGENAKAAGIWRETARILRRNSDLPRALEALRNASRCEPADFGSREGILEILRAMKDSAGVVEEGRTLAEMFLKHGLLNRARSLLGNLVSLAPQDARLRKLYALTLIGLNEKHPALMQLRELAGILERDPSRAGELKEVYRRILALDRTDKRTRRRLLVATGAARRVLIARLVTAAAALVMLLAGGYFLYERSARQSIGEGLNLDELLLDHEFERARALVKETKEKYPYSRFAGRVDAYLAQIDEFEDDYLKHGLKADMLAARRAREAGKYAEASRILDSIARLDARDDSDIAACVLEAKSFVEREQDASRRVKDGQDLVASGNVEGGLRILRSVRASCPDTKAVAAIEWPVRIETVPAGAKLYLNGAEIGTTPFLAYYSLGLKTRIQVEARGFQTWQLEVKDVLPEQLVVALQREVAWTFAADGPFEASPVLHNGTLFAVGRDQYLYAIDAQTGREKFRTFLGVFGDSSSTPVVKDGVIVVGTSRGELLGIDSGLGRVMWRHQTGNSIVADLAADPVASAVYATVSDGGVLAVTPGDGQQVLWTQHTARASPSSGPAAAASLVFVGSYDRRSLVAMDPKSGEEKWTVDAKGAVAGGVAVDGDWVCFGSDDKSVRAVNHQTGAVFGPYPVAGTVRARPALRDRMMWFGSVDGTFYCQLVTEQPKEVWRQVLGDPIYAEPAIHGDRVYVGTTGGRLFCMDRKTGDILWRFDIDGKIVTRPAVADGMVYLAGMDGKIRAIRD